MLQADAGVMMRTAAREAAPHEVCGLLFGRVFSDGSGPDGAAYTIAGASLAKNIAAESWHRFEIDPTDLFAAHRRGREGPDRLIGCWHSHPDGNPRPSHWDRAGVTDMHWLWLIVAADLISGWLPVDGGFAAVALTEMRF